MMPQIGRDSGSAVSLPTPAGSGLINQRGLTSIGIQASQIIMKAERKTVLKFTLMASGTMMFATRNFPHYVRNRLRPSTAKLHWLRARRNSVVRRVRMKEIGSTLFSLINSLFNWFLTRPFMWLMSVCTQLHVYGKLNAISTLISHVMPTYSRDLLAISYCQLVFGHHRNF